MAIIGATDTGGNHYSKLIFDNLRATNTDIKIHLVNPRRAELWGEPVHASCQEVPDSLDLLLVTVGSDHVITSLEDGAANGASAAIVYANDFGEGVGSTSADRVELLRKLCERNNIRVCGPNCMGVLSIRERLLFYPSPRVRDFPAGSVGVVFQSGGTFQFWMQQGAIRGLGFSYAVSSGNELDLDIADYIGFMVDDPSTRLIACLAEGIRRPDAFMAAAAKALDAGKPIIMTKIGSSERGSRATKTHTGSLANNDDVFNAVCRKYGVIRAENLDDLMEFALAFQANRLPHGKRVAMVCHSGGAKGLFLDSAAKQGAELAELTAATSEALQVLIDPTLPAESPLDIGAAAARNRANYTRICQAILSDADVDMLAIQGNLPMSPGERDIDRVDYSELLRTSSKPIVVFGRHRQNLTAEATAIQAATGVPFLQGIPEALRAVNALAAYAAARRTSPNSLIRRCGTSEADRSPTEILASRVGIEVPRSVVVTDVGQVSDAVARIAKRVAIKIVSAQALHKTEVGGVTLNVTPADADGVARGLQSAFERRVPGGRIDGFLVQEMVEGLELIIGVRTDPQFGPYMVAGLGGILVEVMQDVSIRLLPVDQAQALEMLGELRGAPLLGPFRGRPARDIDAAAKAVAALSDFYLTNEGRVHEIEINPLMVQAQGEGAMAVDVRIIENAEKLRDGL